MTEAENRVVQLQVEQYGGLSAITRGQEEARRIFFQAQRVCPAILDPKTARQ